MKWIKTSEVCLESEDGKMVIAKFMVRGEWKYQLTRLGRKSGRTYEGSESLHIGATAQECKERTTHTTLGGGGSD